MLDVTVKGSAYRGGVALRQIDLICSAIDGEANSRIRLRAV
jgi:hypothetical protein